MSKRDRLGRGLGALLGEYLEAPAEETAAVRSLPVTSIAPNPFQPRREFSDEELGELTESIRENGLLQPIVVRPAGAGAGAAYELVAGERRWRAIGRLGWREVPAVVRDVDDRTLLVLAMVENLQRAELSALEEAEGYRLLGEQFGLSHQEIAEAVGRDRSTVANTLRLLHLPASVKRLVQEGRLSAGHARALLGVGDERRMAELGRKAVDGGWSVRQVEAAVKRGRVTGDGRARRARVARDPAGRRLEEELQRALGTQARIRRGRGAKGAIEIPFFDSEDFERIFELLTNRSVSDVV